MPEPVTIVGATGALGFGLALRLGAAGCAVTIGSRDAARAVEAAEKARERVPGGTFTGAANDEAVRGEAEVVVLSVPFRNQSETLTNLRGAWREGQLCVDCTVPLAAAVSGKATRTLGVPQGSAAAQAQEMVDDGVRVVSALHTVSAAALADLSTPLAEDTLLCGQKKADKRRVAALLGLVEGLRPVDAGPLEQAKVAEQLTAFLIGFNARYKAHTGIRVTGLEDRELWPAPSSS